MLIAIITAIVLAYITVYAFAVNWELSSAEDYEAKRTARLDVMAAHGRTSTIS